ncbi:MAG: O-antigen ligase family protein [Endomicrobiales bacterium]|nr:O-antigen ligase family protein [Endomicrobiales bacterium]
MRISTHSINKKIVELSEQIISYGLPVLYFLISIAFYLRTYDSAQIKITLIQIGGTIIIATWLIKVIEEGVTPFLRKNLVLIMALLAFLASGIISFCHSPFVLASTNELIRRVIYIFIAIIVLKEFNSEEKLDRLFNWLVAACFVSTIYGVIQYLDTKYFPAPPEPGLDPFIWRGAFGNRVFSTFGNPNFFGDFLVVMSPITLALFLYSRKFYLLVLWVLILLNIYWTHSKGAWLGFGAGIVIFVFLVVGFFLKAQKEKLRKILFAMVICTVSVVSAGIYKNLQGRPDSASFRIFTWISTWEMINTRPWLGTGIGTFYVTYPAWRRPQIFFIEGRHNTETDHPENEYLEVWYDEGFLGMGIFLWLLLMFLMMSFQSLNTFTKPNITQSKSDVRAYYELGVLTALLAQLAHNLVCVSLRFVSSGIFLWLLIGLIGALNANHPLPLKLEEDLSKQKTNIPVFIQRALQFSVLLISIYFIYIFYGFFDADVNHNLAIFYSKQGKWDEALKHYNIVTKKNPSFIMAHYFIGNVYNDRWGEGDAERSINKYKDVWSLAPNYVQSRHQAGLIYLKWGQDEQAKAQAAKSKGELEKAQQHENKKMELWNKALYEFERYRTIDPIFPLNYYRIAWIYMQLGQPDKAEEIYLAHLNYPEKLKEPPHNAWVEDWSRRRKVNYSETCVNLGNLYVMQEKTEKGEEYYKKAAEYDPKSVNALKNLAIIYGRKNQVQDAIEVWKKLRKIAPNDPDVKKMFNQ